MELLCCVPCEQRARGKGARFKKPLRVHRGARAKKPRAIQQTSPKSKDCYTHVKKGMCPKGSNCPYRHGDETSRSVLRVRNGGWCSCAPWKSFWHFSGFWRLRSPSIIASVSQRAAPLTAHAGGPFSSLATARGSAWPPTPQGGWSAHKLQSAPKRAGDKISHACVKMVGVLCRYFAPTLFALCRYFALTFFVDILPQRKL